MASSWAGEDDLEVIAAERIEAGECAPYSGILGKANELATATKLKPRDQMAFWRFLISVDDDVVLLPFVDPERNPVCLCGNQIYGAIVLNCHVDPMRHLFDFHTGLLYQRRLRRRAELA